MPQPGRRAFLRGKNPRDAVAIIRPPWSVAEAEFTRFCERCDACIQVCPEHLLQRGDGGFPEADFKRGECVFCSKCKDSCKAPVFITDEPTPENAWDLSVTIASSCLSLNAVVCRTCGDHCDARAIRFRLQTGAVAVPEINSSQCTGCGACLYACPVNAVSITNNLRENRVA